MKRPLIAWLMFAICLTALLTVMSYVTIRVVQLESAAAESRLDAARQEKIRLALWRLDAMVTPMIALEDAMPYESYSANSNAEKTEKNALDSKEVTFFAQSVKSRFTIFRKQGGQTDENNVNKNLPFPDLAKVLDNFPDIKTEIIPKFNTEEIDRSPLNQQSASNRLESRARSLSLSNMSQSRSNINSGLLIVQHPVQAVWVRDLLMLLRHVRIGPRSAVQGALLDWDTIRITLLESVSDILPKASLTQRLNGAAMTELSMASLPVELTPGKIPIDISDQQLNIVWPLVLSWAVVLTAISSAALLLHSAISLGQRRGRFVSAVTHELRTPLTTFRLYTDLLASGAITEAEKRSDYIIKLQAQASRLGHLVENVLSFSRLDGRKKRRPQQWALSELIQRCVSVSTERLSQAQMTLETEIASGADQIIVLADIDATEQIIANLIDNACKYASCAKDKSIKLRAEASKSKVIITVQDCGPGISPEQASQIFQPFSRSDRQAAGSAPGVGLGLALSRQLARQMGAKLCYKASNQGACFELELQRPRNK